VDTSVFTKLAAQKKTDDFIIGCIGVIGENKNQLFVLKALRKLPKNVVLHCYGKEDENYRATLDSFIETNGLQDRVSFKGFVDNVNIPKVQATFTVLVLASKNEGLPLSILEAMVCGVPVLSSNSGGGAMYLLQDHAGGFIFESEAELVSQLLQLYEHPELCTQLGAAGRKRVQEHFSIEKEVNAYKELYLSLLT